MTTHVMLDLDTFGIKPFSVIIAIGACAFDPFATIEKTILKSFTVAIDPVNSQALGLRIDAEAVVSWFDQSRDKAREAWNDMAKHSLLDALDGFEEWMRPYRNAPLWGTDHGLLRDAYQVANRSIPWDWKNNRDYRTLVSLSPCEVTSMDDVPNSRKVNKDKAYFRAILQAHAANTIISQIIPMLPVEADTPLGVQEASLVKTVFAPANTPAKPRLDPLAKIVDDDDLLPAWDDE